MGTEALEGGGLVAKLCLTLVTPWTVGCQAPLSVRFSRQEYWSGLPFPSPGDLLTHGSNLCLPVSEDRFFMNLSHHKSPVKLLRTLKMWVCVLSRFSCVWLFVTPGFSVHEILQQEYWSGLPFLSPGDLPDPGIERRPPAWQADSWPSEPPGRCLVTC